MSHDEHRPSIDDLQENIHDTFGDVTSAKAKELEVILADMETRLRATIIRVLRPALEQVSDVDQRVQDVAAKVEKQEALLGSVDEINDRISQNSSLTKVLQDLLNENMEQVRHLERTTTDKIGEITSIHTRIDATVQDHESDLQRLQREDVRIWEETKRIQKSMQTARKQNEEAIQGCHKRTSAVQEDLDEKIKDLVLKRAELVDDIFGKGKGLDVLSINLNSLNDFVKPLPELQASLVKLDKDIKEERRLQSEFQEEFKRNTKEFHSYVGKQAAFHAEAQEEFRTQTNYLASHHASLMKNIRTDYATEINSIKEMRTAISKTLTISDKTCKELEVKLDSESRRIDAIAKELAQDMDELIARRKKDRVDIEADHHQLRLDFGAEKENLTSTRNSVDFLSKVCGLMIEGSRVGCALQIQDFADRSQERWVTMPNEKAAAPAQPFKASELEKQRQKKEDIGFRDSQELLTDVRKGLARGGYQPGQIPFSGRNFDRRDLLILQNRLLHKAQQAYAHGPEHPVPESNSAITQSASRTASMQPKSGSFATKGISDKIQPGDVEVAMQPSANGGISAEPLSLSAKKYPIGGVKDIDSESPKPPQPASHSPGALTEQRARQRPGSQGQSGSRQRPGSQGQPQAVGSRGTASGPLGETEPPPGYESPLRLPPISARGTEGAPKAAGSPIDSRPGTGHRPHRPGNKTAR